LARCVLALLRGVGAASFAVGRVLGRGLAHVMRRRKSDAPAITRPEPAARREDSSDIPIVRKVHTTAEDDTVVEEPAQPAPEPTILPIPRNPQEPPADNLTFDDYELPSLSLLDDPAPFPWEEHDQKLRDTAVLLEKTFKDFELNVRVVGINTGPVITQYEV